MYTDLTYLRTLKLRGEVELRVTQERVVRHDNGSRNCRDQQRCNKLLKEECIGCLMQA
jgi:hypothetical protein